MLNVNRSRGFGEQVTILAQNGARPCDEVLGALTAGLRFDPQFKVLGSVIPPISVPVMDVFAVKKIPAKQSGHDKPVFLDVAVGIRQRMSRHTDLDIAAVSDKAPAAPALSSRMMPVNVTVGVACVLPEARTTELHDFRCPAATAGAYPGQQTSFFFGWTLTHPREHSFAVLRNARPVSVDELRRSVLVVRLGDDFGSAPALAKNTHTSSIA